MRIQFSVIAAYLLCDGEEMVRLKLVFPCNIQAISVRGCSTAIFQSHSSIIAMELVLFVTLLDTIMMIQTFITEISSLAQLVKSNSADILQQYSLKHLVTIENIRDIFFQILDKVSADPNSRYINK